MKLFKVAVIRGKTGWLLFALLLIQTLCLGQENIIVNLAMLDGIELTPDNIFNYQIINNSGSSKEVTLKGTVRYRNSPLRFSYSLNTVLNTGNNLLSKDRVHPQWDFSQSALRELFFNYKKLPQGTYEYCVELTVTHVGGDAPDFVPVSDCIYQKVDDIFLINLIEPEDDAKLYEYYPMFNWVVNYPFASELTYRIRVAELKQGQSKQNAITRNNPVYQDRNVLSTSTVYPVTAKPLETFQPYVWTVDAYYKGILLGGADVWKFTIIEDSLLKEVPKDPPFVELNTETGTTVFYAVGKLKLKYIEKRHKTDQIHFTLTDEKNRVIKLKQDTWQVSVGDNRLIIPFHETINLKHWKNYTLTAETTDGKKYIIPFKYVNPLYLK